MRSIDLRRLRRAGLASHVPRERRGLTVVEIVVAMSILIVAASIFVQMLLSTSRMQQLNRENTAAADAARVVLERMRNQTFLDVFRNFNADPNDDPGGKGTGAGHLFDVAGLQPLDDAPQGKVGQVAFPCMPVEVTTTENGTQTAVTTYQLREDSTDKALGMPRDLDGNNVVDTADHSKNYLVLPVRIEIQWKGRSGARSFEIETQLADFKFEEEP